MTPTGNIRFKVYRKKLILQLEFNYPITENAGASVDVRESKCWKDARVEDLFVIPKLTELMAKERG